MAALLRGEVAPFAPPLAHVVARGYNLYFPFPFARRCLVTVDDIVSPDPFTGRPIAKLYYQIGYRRYSRRAGRARASLFGRRAGARRPDDRGASRRRCATDRPPPASAAGRAPGRDRAPRRSAPGHASVTTVAGAARRRRAGRAAHRDATNGHPETLRATRLSIAFDGETTVDAPLIDFFGTGPGWNTYTSLPMTVAGDGVLVCRFRMPFAKQAVVTIARGDPGTIDIGGRIVLLPAPLREGQPAVSRRPARAGGASDAAVPRLACRRHRGARPPGRNAC